MLRLPEIGSHATYQQFLSQLIGHKHLKKKKRKSTNDRIIVV